MKKLLFLGLLFFNNMYSMNSEATKEAALFKACQDNDVNVVCALIEAKTNVNVYKTAKRTPLFFAQSVEVAKSLINAGAIVNVRSAMKTTPLSHVPSMDIIELLFKSGAEIDSPIVEYRIKNMKNENDYLIIRYLLFQKTNLDLENGYEKLFNSYWYGLEIEKKMSSLLLYYGVPVACRDLALLAADSQLSERRSLFAFFWLNTSDDVKAEFKEKTDASSYFVEAIIKGKHSEIYEGIENEYRRFCLKEANLGNTVQYVMNRQLGAYL